LVGKIHQILDMKKLIKKKSLIAMQVVPIQQEKVNIYIPYLFIATQTSLSL